ncbi:MAG: hypothetical protein VX975_02870, partial [Acidobacteriota bacterium]|nr:hypothetical protein [Acidobacteriota bacterium]
NIRKAGSKARAMLGVIASRESTVRYLRKAAHSVTWYFLWTLVGWCSLLFAAVFPAWFRHVEMDTGYVTPEDVRSIGLDVLRHRVLLTYEAEAEEMTSDDVVNLVLNSIEVP